MEELPSLLQARKTGTTMKKRVKTPKGTKIVKVTTSKGVGKMRSIPTVKLVKLYK